MLFWCFFIFLSSESITACDNKTLNNFMEDMAQTPSLFGKDDYLDIYDYNFSKLCQEMFAIIPKINVLNVYNCHVTEIEPNFLQFYSNVSKVIITQNKIFKIQSETFANLATVFIILSFNYIRVVENQAFKNLQKLIYLDLNSNQLVSFDSNWFEEVPHLNEINLAINNISALPENSFKFLETSNAKLWFNKNQIRFLHENTMAGTAAKDITLSLIDNLIDKIPNGFFKNLTFDQIQLSGNPIENLPDDFFISKFTVQTLSLPLHQFNKKIRNQLRKWSIQKKTKIIDTINFLEKNCSSKVLFNVQIFFFLLFFRQVF